MPLGTRKYLVYVLVPHATAAALSPRNGAPFPAARLGEPRFPEATFHEANFQGMTAFRRNRPPEHRTDSF